MLTHDSHQLSSYNSDSLSWANEDKLNESNELNELNTSNIPEDVYNLDAESGSSFLDQLLSSRVTVTNSLITDKDGLKKECGNDYELSTGTGNLKAHLPSNQPLLHDFINKKTLLPTSKQDKIANHILAWIIDDLQPFNATTNNCFHDMILECEPRFEFPCYDKLKEKLMQSVLFAEQQLKELLQITINSFCFTTDLWSQMHQPYIAVTIHWISPEFNLYQALLTIQKFDYPHTEDRIEDFCRQLFDKWKIYEKLLDASTDNAASMIKAMDQLGVELIGCTAHTIQLALGDEFDNTEVSNLISKAKTLNSYVSSKDKYCESLCELQAKLNLQHQVNPLSSDTRTCWSSTYNLLKNLFLLHLLLSTEEWSSIDELAKLLYSFAQATEYIRGSQYPTLRMMISTLIKLSRHLREFYPIITSQTSNSCLFDPRFKQINYVTAKSSTFIQESQSLNTNSSLFSSSFYDDDYVIQNETENMSLIEKEVTLYDTMLHLLSQQARKYLAFPATSVPSERVFSTASNTITNKRNQLDPDTIHDLLFLKENSKIFTVYPGLGRKFY
ncbi:2642_t:CDS:2 [Cetraspora pellucida]|uniref:2642_t:CDS:1 n=1 Tax=Cetraspora pellucida TaxID=1433469 RepID=A0ACA9K4E2_9GLOM|nr:2642_t:CDS:2 [Cetraspora pellucida]